MRRGRIFIFLALILIIGLAVVAFVFRQFLPAPLGGQTAEAPSDGTQQGMTVEVYVARQYIPQGGDITEDVIATTRIPVENQMDVMFTVNEKEQLLNLTARYPIDQGVFITSSMVGEGTSGPEWASETNIPNGQVAIAIPTSRLASAAFGVQEGARVDISACFLFLDVDPSFQSKLPNNVDVLTGPANVTPEEQAGLTLGVSGSAQQGRTEVESAFQQGIYIVPSEAQRPRLVCQNIVQNAFVLKLGSFPLPGAPAIAEQPEVEEAGVAPQPQEIPDIVTLVVLPQESVTLSYLVHSGAKITLSLRNNLDDSRTATEAATLQFLLSQYNIPVPAKLPYAMDPRIDNFDSSAASSEEELTTVD
jgi:pilus assembly protein CpaB